MRCQDERFSFIVSGTDSSAYASDQNEWVNHQKMPLPKEGRQRTPNIHTAQSKKETLLVAHELSDGSTAVSQLSTHGAQRFGSLPGSGAGSNEFRAHRAWSGGFPFRSNGAYLNTISEFSPDGTLKSHDCADYFPMDSRLVSYLVMMIELAPTPPKGALVTATRLPSVMLMA